MSIFGKRLKTAMQQLNLKQSQVAGITGCSKGAVSQYLSGKNVPSADKQRDIAASLGLDTDYFEQEGEQAAVILSRKERGSIRQLQVTDVAKLLGMNHTTVRKGLQQGVFPWGYAIRTSEHRWAYFINAVRFAKIEEVELRSNREMFMETEFGKELEETIRCWDHALDERSKARCQPGESGSGLGFEYWDRTCRSCQGKWEVFKLVIKQFCGVEYNFTRTEDFFGLVTDDEKDWLIKEGREGEA